MPDEQTHTHTTQGYEYPPPRDYADYSKKRSGIGGALIALLLIPALALLGVGGYQLYKTMSSNQAAKTTDQSEKNKVVDSNAGAGVGGGPNDTPTPTKKPTATVTPKTTVSPTPTGGQQGVGGAGDDDATMRRNIAPNTGKGE